MSDELDERRLFGSDRSSDPDDLAEQKVTGSDVPGLLDAHTSSGFELEQQFLYWDLEDDASGIASTGTERLKDVLLSAKILHDPDPCNTSVAKDRIWMPDYYELPDEDDNPDGLSPWMLRLAFDMEVLERNGLAIRSLAGVLTIKTLSDLDAIFTDHGVDPAIMRSSSG